MDCVTRITKTSDNSSFRTLKSRPRVSLSKAELASSKIKMGFGFRSALAMARRCRCPP